MTGKGSRLGWMMAVGLGLALSPRAAAEEPQSLGYWDGAGRKLGRGAANVVTAPLELIRNPYVVSEQDGALAGLTIGLVQGVKDLVVRAVAGVYEVATFMLPIPKGFRPLVSPEFVYAHGDWAP